MIFLKRLLERLALALRLSWLSLQGCRGIATLTATQIAQLDNAIPERPKDSPERVIFQ